MATVHHTAPKRSSAPPLLALHKQRIGFVVWPFPLCVQASLYFSCKGYSFTFGDVELFHLILYHLLPSSPPHCSHLYHLILPIELTQVPSSSYTHDLPLMPFLPTHSWIPTSYHKPFSSLVTQVTFSIAGAHSIFRIFSLAILSCSFSMSFAHSLIILCFYHHIVIIRLARISMDKRLCIHKRIYVL